MAQEKFAPVWVPGAKAMALTKDEEIPCRLCKKPTPMLGTKLCDRCWELETRIHYDPELATQIISKIGKKEEQDKSRLRSLMQKLCPIQFRFSKGSQDDA